MVLGWSWGGFLAVSGWFLERLMGFLGWFSEWLEWFRGVFFGGHGVVSFSFWGGFWSGGAGFGAATVVLAWSWDGHGVIFWSFWGGFYGFFDRFDRLRGRFLGWLG